VPIRDLFQVRAYEPPLTGSSGLTFRLGTLIHLGGSPRELKMIFAAYSPVSPIADGGTIFEIGRN
jgi:hypothetical protein